MTRTGKIARLPLSIRDQLNRRLLDNEPGPSLLGWLNSLRREKDLFQADSATRRLQQFAKMLLSKPRPDAPPPNSHPTDPSPGNQA